MTQCICIKPTLNDLETYGINIFNKIPYEFCNYYLKNYTTLPLIGSYEEKSPSALWANYNMGIIVEALLLENGVKVYD